MGRGFSRWLDFPSARGSCHTVQPERRHHQHGSRVKWSKVLSWGFWILTLASLYVEVAVAQQERRRVEEAPTLEPSLFPDPAPNGAPDLVSPVSPEPGASQGEGTPSEATGLTQAPSDPSLEVRQLGLPPGTRRVVIFLPERPSLEVELAGTYRLDEETLLENLPNYVEVEPQWTAYTHFYTPEIRTRLERFFPEDNEQRRCGETNQGDFIRLELARLTLLLGTEVGDEAVLQQLETLISHFHCQSGSTYLTPLELRQVLLWQGVWYYLAAYPEERAEQWFQEAYRLGQHDQLGDGLEGTFGQGGLWVAYTRAVQKLHQSAHRIPVYLDASLVPYRKLAVDGEEVVLARNGQTPLLLYPGRHFLQVRDTRGRIRSALLEVPDQRNVRVTLGTHEWLPPQADEADELLRMGLRTELMSLPPWFRDALQDYQRSYGLEEIYLVTPRDDPRDGPAGELVSETFGGETGLLELERDERGEVWISRQALGRFVPKSDVASRWETSLGTGVFQASGVATLELRYTVVTGGDVELQAGVSAMAFWLEQAMPRGLGGFWLGCAKVPERPRLAWVGGGGFGIAVVGTQTRPLTLENMVFSPMARLHAGVEWATGRMGALVWHPSVRLEAVVEVVPMAAALGDVQTLPIAAGARVSVKGWRWK